MKNFLLYLIICFVISSCMMRYPTSYLPAPSLKSKYADKLEPGSTLEDWGYTYTFEKTADSKFIYKEYFPDTRQLITYQTYVDKGKTLASGPYKYWWDDGTLTSEGEYFNGKREGEWNLYAENNKSTGKYVNGLQEGLWIGIDSLGNKRSEINFKAGKRHGVFKDWNEAGVLTREGTYTDDVLDTEKRYTDDAVEPALYNVVTKQPRFPGCGLGTDEERKKCAETKMLQFIYSNIKYPPFARENGIQGSAYIRFVVEKDGSISNIKTVRGICTDIKNECERVIRMMPTWEPGEQNGKPVRVRFTLPIKFKLE